MSKLKKLSLTIISTIILGLALTNISNATDRDPNNLNIDPIKAGDTVTLTREQARKASKENGLFCIYNMVEFGDGKPYKAVSVINIEGNNSTDQTGHTEYNNWDNGRLAYILHNSKGNIGAGSFHDDRGNYPAIQWRIWDVMPLWINAVGKKHEGLYPDIASNNKKEWIRSEKQNNEDAKVRKDGWSYAERIAHEEDRITNKTNKDSIKVKQYTKDGKEYLQIGPFKYNFNNIQLTSVELSQKNGPTITPSFYGVYDGDTLKTGDIKKIKSGTSFYVLIPSDGSITEINKIKVKYKYNTISAKLVFWKNTQNSADTVGYQNIMQFKTWDKENNDDLPWDVNIPVLGNLKITKKDYGDGKNLSGVTFKIYNEQNKYIKRDSKGNISYVDEKDATLFETDKNGEVKIEKLRIGKYTIAEITNKNVVYSGDNNGKVESIYYNTNEKNKKNKVKDNKIQVNVTANGNNYANVFIYNEKTYIDISGKVWTDRKPNGKDSERDDVLHIEQYQVGNDTYEPTDKLLMNIKVLLKDRKSGNTVQEATTNENGEYKFTNVKISELENYYVEFEYDGLQYTSVKALVGNDDKINSKASEVVTQRTAVNAGFNKITNNGDIADRNHGKANGDPTRTITYDNDTANYKSTLSMVEGSGKQVNDHTETARVSNINPAANLTANTDVASYKLKEQFKNAVSGANGALEIQNVNLGLYEREQPNISIRNDLTSVKVQVNGYGNVYTKDSSGNAYGTREEYKTNIAAKFESGSGYTRELYPSDIQFSSSEAGKDDAKKLKVYATYSITVSNYSNSLAVSVPEILNYYDPNYEIVENGTEFPNSKLNGVEVVSLNNQSYSGQAEITKTSSVNGYNAATIKVADGAKIDSGNTLVINVTYRVNDDTVKKLLGEGDQTLNTVTEIASYTTYYGQDLEGHKIGDVYAGIDMNSAPGNATPGKVETYEDDTDRAPAFKLTAKGARQIEGTIFEDATAAELKTGEERKGNGVFDNGENTVKGVKVELLTKDGNKATYYPNAVSDDGQTAVNGSDGAQDAITVDETGHYIFKGIEPDQYMIKFTYGDQTFIKDKQITAQNYKSTIINSPIRDAFENNDAHKTWYNEKAEIRNSDARDNFQVRMQLDEELKDIDVNTTYGPKILDALTPYFEIPMEFDSIITDSNNNTFIHKISNIDFGIVERPRQAAKFDKTITHIKVTLPNGQPLIDGDVDLKNKKVPEGIAVVDNKLVITMDNELIYGSQVEIGYVMTLTNASEIDYIGENYYYYYSTENCKPVTFTSAALIDYVDSEMVLKAGQDGTWRVLDLAENGLNQDYASIIKDYDKLRETLKNQFSTLVVADKLISTDKPIAAGESAKANIYVEKLLGSNETELTFENNGEVVKVRKDGGSILTTKLGSYAPVLAENPDSDALEIDEGKSATVSILPPTGSTDKTVMYAVIATASLVILGVGTYGVRRFLKK